MATTEMIITVIWSKPMLTPRTGRCWCRGTAGKSVLVAVPDLPQADHDEQQARRWRPPSRWPWRSRASGPTNSRTRPSSGPTRRGRGPPQGPRHPVLGVQPVEDEHGEGGDGPVGEVEDPRGLVGQHQAHAGQAVDRSGGDADDDERKEVLHESALPAGDAGAHGATERRCSSYAACPCSRPLVRCPSPRTRRRRSRLCSAAPLAWRRAGGTAGRTADLTRHGGGGYSPPQRYHSPQPGAWAGI